MNEWISVKDRLPESDGSYIAHSGKSGKVFTAHFWARDKIWSGRNLNLTITHWMPMPEPPKVKGNAPMTLEELRKMDGKPAYFRFGDGTCGYAVVSCDEGRLVLYGPSFEEDHTYPDEDFINMEMDNDPHGHFGLHMLGWRAYRYKPEEE